MYGCPLHGALHSVQASISCAITDRCRSAARRLFQAHRLASGAVRRYSAAPDLAESPDQVHSLNVLTEEEARVRDIGMPLHVSKPFS